MKILVCAFAYNNKFPVDLQYAQFRKYVTEPFEYVLFNDARCDKEASQLNRVALKLNIKCVRVPQKIHASNNPSEGYAHTLNWTLTYLKSEEIVVFVHTDVFPVHTISILDIIQDKEVATTIEHRTVGNSVLTYFYPALTLINMKIANLALLDFSCRRGISSGVETIDNIGLDTGGMTYKYISNRENGVKFIKNHPLVNASSILSLENAELSNYFERMHSICNRHSISEGWYAVGFYHYIDGSQWNKKEKAEGRALKLAECLKFFPIG